MNFFWNDSAKFFQPFSFIAFCCFSHIHIQFIHKLKSFTHNLLFCFWKTYRFNFSFKYNTQIISNFSFTSPKCLALLFLSTWNVQLKKKKKFHCHFCYLFSFLNTKRGKRWKKIYAHYAIWKMWVRTVNVCVGRSFQWC